MTVSDSLYVGLSLIHKAKLGQQIRGHHLGGMKFGDYPIQAKIEIYTFENAFLTNFQDD